jgi:signal peptidase I
MSIYMLLTLSFFLASAAGLWRIFEKAGHAGWMAIVPFYNIYIWLKVIHKPLWWYLFVLIPFINVFTLLLMVVDTLKCFNKHGLLDQALGVIFPFIYLPYLGFAPGEHYVHPTRLPVIKKTAAREWADAIIFAVVAAVIIRTFMVEAYTIPTSSMEKSLLVGDYLFVSKVSYGPKVPNTPIAFPFAHHTLPLTEYTKSYVEWVRLPYYRFPGLRSIRNNDVVVFNYPDGDTVALQMQNQSYYALVREMGRDAVWGNYDVISRPVDKRENYIKRAVGIAGDTLQIIDGIVHINGTPLPDMPGVQHNYQVMTDGTPLSPRTVERLGVTEWGQAGPNLYILATGEEAAGQIRQLPHVISTGKMTRPAGNPEFYVFPHNPLYPWNEDQFGPLFIPARGSTVAINHQTIPLYERLIGVYEGNTLEITDDDILINGQPATSYTFEMDYYFMMGDNRHNSADSRFWGLVPEDHIVGRAMFVWLSLDNTKSFPARVRFNKTFRIIR